MKTKIKLIVLALMATYCIMPNSTLRSEAGSATKTVAVHAYTWTVHGIYEKSATSNYVSAINYAGYGEYAYCYGQVRSNLSGTWTAYTSNYTLTKGGGRITMYLSRTIDKGKNISLRLIGANSQTGDDNNRVQFNY